MFLYRIFRDILCRQFEHFAIFYVVNSNISRYFMSLIQTFRDTFCRRNHQYVVQTSEKNQRVESSLFCSSNSIIKEYDLFKKNVMKKVFDTKFSIQKNEMIIISQIMCQYRKRCYESLCNEQFEFFASNRIRELSLFFSFRSTTRDENTNDARRRLCKLSSSSNYLNLLCAIYVLNFRCDMFISST
jgi:hypothetical protein